MRGLSVVETFLLSHPISYFPRSHRTQSSKLSPIIINITLILMAIMNTPLTSRRAATIAAIIINT